MTEVTIKNRDELIRRAEWHRDQDNLAQGTYAAIWQGKLRFCAVGCLAIAPERYANLDFRERAEGTMWRTMDGEVVWGPQRVLKLDFNIPEQVYDLADNIFEELPLELARFFPEQFARALPETLDSDAVQSFYWNNDVTWKNAEQMRDKFLSFLKSHNKKEVSMEETPQQGERREMREPDQSESVAGESAPNQPHTPGGTPLPSEPTPAGQPGPDAPEAEPVPEPEDPADPNVVDPNQDDDEVGTDDRDA